MSAVKTFFGSFLQGFGLEGFGERLSIPGVPARIFVEESQKSNEQLVETILGRRHFLTIDLDSLETSPLDPEKLSADELHRIVTVIEEKIRFLRSKNRESAAAKRAIMYDAAVSKVNKD